jgi:FkbM family methyltransferase
MNDYKLLRPDGRILRFPTVGLLFSYASISRFPVYEASEHHSLIVDVGACIGCFSLPYAERFPNARVLAFEPWPPCWEYFADNLSGLNNVFLEKCAVGNENGTVELSMLEGKFDQMGNASAYGNGADVASAKCVRLDDALNLQIDLIKIDVEGMELKVIEGASGLIKEYRPDLIVEIKQTHQERAGSSTGKLIDSIVALGYDEPRHMNGHDYLFRRRRTL